MITLTERAAKKVLANIKNRGAGLGIMLGTKPNGCSGLSYTLEYVDASPVTRDYMTYESHGVRIWVNGRDLPHVDGMTMDWKRQGLQEGFDFINPNERDRCGCGESFRT